MRIEMSEKEECVELKLPPLPLLVGRSKAEEAPVLGVDTQRSVRPIPHPLFHSTHSDRQPFRPMHIEIQHSTRERVHIVFTATTTGVP
ncbi:hypothetical protein WUBG_13533 [Wuchereria bancrofti]|uniref:Uncharacterized protein n=1 Tax=Wuchereria bancrofti TaxID=6293 RepID=J9EEZ3_WUCBA|nr:hypothetical protein WUBG_13533 [Wuchereria bancrofti]